MAKEEWGVKRACPKCAVRFYDLQNDPMTCPSCDAEFSLESLTDTGKSRVAQDRAKAAAKPEVDEADVVLDDTDDSEKAADDDLLDDDDDADTANLEEVADVAKEDDDS